MSDNVRAIFNIDYPVLTKEEEIKLFTEYTNMKNRLIYLLFRDLQVLKTFYDDIINKRYYDIFHYNANYFRKNKSRFCRRNFIFTMKAIKEKILEYINKGIGDDYNDFVSSLPLIKMSYLLTFKNKVDNEEIKSLYDEVIKVRNKIWNHNIRLVTSIAKKHYTNEPDFDDYVSEGQRGLEIAIDRYDVTRKYKFSTYATRWIECKMREYKKRSEFIQIPTKYKKIYHAVTAMLMEKPNLTVFELADAIGCSEDDVRKVLETYVVMNIDDVNDIIVNENLNKNSKEYVNLSETIFYFLSKFPPQVANILKNLLKFEATLSPMEIAQINNTHERRYFNLLIFTVSYLLNHASNGN